MFVQFKVPPMSQVSETNSISVVIPTFGRNQVLADTIRYLLALPVPPCELILIDQTPRHDVDVEAQLSAWTREGRIRWIRRAVPSITGAMNDGLTVAGGDWVLFLDDDVVPSEALLEAHASAVARYPDAWAVVGQVLQPGETPQPRIAGQLNSSLHRDLDFPFNSSIPGWVTNVMAGNLCIKRERAIEVGGFDENFGPPVAYRFETEFAKRLIRCGGKIRFEPAASIRHLRVPTGGTRSQGSHLASSSPVHGVGDYYYALRCGCGWARIGYIVWRMFREVRTRFHLRHPWTIPVKLVGEVRALGLALRLSRRKPGFIMSHEDDTLVTR